MGGQRSVRHLPYQTEVGALCFDDYKGANNQYVETDKLIVEGMKKMESYGFDPGATRDVGVAFYKEESKTLTNGSCPGFHQGTVVVKRWWNGEKDISDTHKSQCRGAQRMPDKDNFNAIVENEEEYEYAVRRLTELECERLQGFPSGWTDIGDWVDSKGKTRKTTASARYKALGNSIALPFWKHLAKRISARYERPITMGSLFSGIGGFEYCFESVNGKGTARWASEIEEFPIAVTKYHFPEEPQTERSTPPTAYTAQDREGKPGGGKGLLVQENLSATLKPDNSQYLFQGEEK